MAAIQATEEEREHARLDEVLADVPFFTGMSEASWPDRGLRLHTSFDAGAVLFREGDAADTFYVIRHGTVAIELRAAAAGR